MGSQGPSQLWLRSGQCQLLLGLFWDRKAGQAAAALPGACCSPWGLSCGEEGGGCTRDSAPTADLAWLEQAGTGPGVGAECGRTQGGGREVAGRESRRLEQGGHNFRARRASGPLG